MKLFHKNRLLILWSMVLLISVVSIGAGAYAAEKSENYPERKTDRKVNCTVYVGFTYKLGVVGTNNENVLVDSWKSTNSDVVTVKRIDSKFASMKAVGKGTAYVYAYRNGRKVAVYDVTVKSSMSFSAKTVKLEKGKTKKIKATLVGEGTFSATPVDGAICSVKVTATGNNSAELKLKGLKPGTTTIKIKNSLTKEVAKLKITVTKSGTKTVVAVIK